MTSSPTPYCLMMRRRESRSLLLLLRRKVGRPCAVSPNSSVTASPMVFEPKSKARIRPLTARFSVEEVFSIFDTAKVSWSECYVAASSIRSTMPEEVVDKLTPALPDDSEIEHNAAGGPREIPQVTINRSTVAELEHRRLLRIQTASLTILAVAVVLGMIYVAKLILVVVLVSILLSFVLAPVVDFLLVRQVPRAVGSFIAVSILMIAGLVATYVSYSRALDFAHELPKYKSRIHAIV